jgi:DNA-binding transcriptional regulator YdaS (Cro superfamily)
MRKPTNAGLTADQADRVLDILRKVGFVGDVKALAKLIGTEPKRLSYFIATKQAQEAMTLATDLSRKLYYQELRQAAYPDDEDQETASTSTLSEQDALSLGLSIKERKHMGCHSQKDELKSESDWIKEKDPSMTDAEIAKWNRLADGK